MNATLSAALEYLERGWFVVPINPETKSPYVKWGHYLDNNTQPTEEEVTGWWESWPEARVAICTGVQSGLVVVDCDNEGARREAERLGLTRTPVIVKTKSGYHYYYAYPRGEAWVKNRVGSNSDGSEWPAVEGLDLRGSKGYVLAPPSKNYEWHVMAGCDFDDLPAYVPPSRTQAKKNNVVNIDDFRFEGQSLAHVRAHVSVWESTRALVARAGLLPSGGGNARDDRLWKAIAEGAASGLRGPDLIDEAHRFMDEFFLDHIEPRKVEQMCARVEGMEAKNHPDRLTQEATPPAEPAPARYKPITTADVDRLEAELGTVRYYVEPFIPTSGTIFQVHGYSGHGKSMFVRHLLYACAAGVERFGPFSFFERPRVLYLDFENSKSNVAKFLARCKRSFGDAGDHFMIWAPFAENSELNLRTDAGVREFGEWIKHTKPNIVVIDTIRSAFPGLNENSAEEWGRVNSLCLQLRNAGISVGMLHHSNKPGEGGASGREAGSTNQLTVLETQIKVTQVFQDEVTATANAGLYDGDLPGMPFTTMSGPPAIEDEETLDVMVELRYGKVREWTDMHERAYYLGFASNHEQQTIRGVANKTPKQRAETFARQWVDASGAARPPLSDAEIASRIYKPVHVVEQWTRPIRAMDHASRVANAEEKTPSALG